MADVNSQSWGFDQQSGDTNQEKYQNMAQVSDEFSVKQHWDFRFLSSVKIQNMLKFFHYLATVQPNFTNMCMKMFIYIGYMGHTQNIQLMIAVFPRDRLFLFRAGARDQLICRLLQLLCAFAASVMHYPSHALSLHTMRPKRLSKYKSEPN